MLKIANLRFVSRCLSSSVVRQCQRHTFTNLKLKMVNNNKKFISTSITNYAAHQPFTLKTVEDRIILCLSLYDKIDPEKLTMDSDFFKDMGLDSLDFVEVIVALEDEFSFEIPDGDADRFTTPRHVFRYVCDKFDVYE